MKPTRILLADDHEIVRLGIRQIIEGSPEFTIIGEAGTGREAVEAAAALKPDIIVMDIAMPDMNGLDATRRIVAADPDAKVFILSMHESEEIVRELIAVGASGFALKSEAAATLIAGLGALTQGRLYFTSRVGNLGVRGPMRPEPFAPKSALSPREREVVQLVVEGKANKEIAAILGIGIKTVEAHRAKIMLKLKLHSVAELVRYAIRNHITEA